MRKSLVILLIGDFFLAGLALAAGILLRFGTLTGSEASEIGGWQLLFFAAVLLFSGFFVELYSASGNYRRMELAVRVFIGLCLSFVILSAVYYIFPSLLIGRGVLLSALLIFGVTQIIWHSSSPLLHVVPGFAQKIVILGNGTLGKQIEDLIPRERNNFVFAGYIKAAAEGPMGPDKNVVGTMDNIFETVSRIKPNKIIVSLAERRGVLPVKEILKCKLSGIEVIDAMNFYERLTGKLLVENINPSWFIFSSGFRVTRFMCFYKRVLDVALSLTGIILAAPLMPLIALAVRLDSPGPVFFRQERVGKGEQPFTLIKFRTMRNDAEKNGAVWACKDDPRVTKVGHILRKTRLDEIPQLFNVLKGDMSFVGPRPERPEFVETLKEKIPYYSKRHFVKPGVTGWAQVRYPYGASVEDSLEKLRYDLYYIKNFSIFLDILIILETIKVVLFGRGAR
ncbi:MAG: TIGR03013 family XrtA/PEP-CTERM system glycosyltransferase [Geoalkalibacter sp.]|jgi:sugar transferase (PEP-CTERM system associated)|uniref:TIGR03013 family XrtA/PEP-CTERM system glycosyltransferase n=1 Tax=Geoalkalibacter sp. TaxID=3041440 RepID=UPI002A9CD28C|nr:TIGR03013 family XrtA/PEP-CTERM system glycosyltransferase [Thermodesulfobacteriota bacterium]